MELRDNIKVKKLKLIFRANKLFLDSLRLVKPKKLVCIKIEFLNKTISGGGEGAKKNLAPPG